MHTEHFIFDSLVLTNGFSVPLTLVLLSSEILHSLVVQQTIGVDAPSDLQVHSTTDILRL